MPMIEIDDNVVMLDNEGYLKDLHQWSPAIAAELARLEGIQLTEAHWEILTALRAFYNEFELSPAMRPLVKYVARTLGPDKGKSIYLLGLFPDSPAKRASRIAGLPKPTNCL